MYDSRTRLSDEVAEELRKHFGDLVFDTVIPRSVRLAEAPSYGLPIALYAPTSPGGEAYRAFAEELLTADRDLIPLPAEIPHGA
jgi:chromosome partitioning protein